MHLMPCGKIIIHNYLKIPPGQNESNDYNTLWQIMSTYNCFMKCSCQKDVNLGNWFWLDVELANFQGY